ncbi:MAG: T9SS type A sorting domain-containing protein, partial [Bacteroidota bacterium]
FNQLTSLTTTSLNLSCNHNFLTSLPDLPDSVSYFDISNNAGLTCFPKYKKIMSLTWDSTGITCLPNFGYIGIANPPAPPLCQPASGCNFSWNMYGNVFKDAISNCSIDTNELHLKNIPLLLDSGGNQLQIFITNNEGYYSFETGLGNYQIIIDTTGLPFDVMCPASGNYLSSLTAIDSLDADLDFGLQCKTGYLDLIAKSISPSAQLRPGSQRTLYLNAGDATLFYGVTCSAGVSGSVEAILNGAVSYLSPATGALVPTTVNGDTISWSVNDFSLINPTVDFNIIIRVDSSATVNDTVCVQLNITPVTGDNIPSNNSVSNCFPVVNSFDPNAKEIYPGGFVDTSAHEFTFTIYFQNTGNAVAENIYILDTLDNDLKLNTFQFLSSNHDVITQLLPGRVLRFSFPHINLPDSVSNEPASHGYVQFKISRKNILYPDMIILNHAQIFFDLNPPVTTNDAYAVFNFNCNDLLSISITDTAICENEIVTASNNISFPFPVNYEWMIDTAIVSTTSSVSITGLSAGVHQLTLNVSAGYCAVSDTQQITVYPLPTQPAINISGDTLSTNTGFSYQWFLNSNSINGAVQNNYLISQSGWYSVLITDSNGCSALSDSVFVSPVGIEDASTPLSMTITLYPNPVKDMLYIQTISTPGEVLNIELLDITGRKLQTIFNGKTVSAFSKYSLSLKSFSKGVFVLRVNNLVKRIVVE